MNLTLQDIGNWELDQGKTNPTVHVICWQKMCWSLHVRRLVRPRGYKTFSMLNSAEHKIYRAHKC